MQEAIKHLRAAERELSGELEKVRGAISILEGSGKRKSGKRRLSKAGREAISKAAKQRWASYRRAKGAK